jgi:SAM-dependent methyltransferase
VHVLRAEAFDGLAADYDVTFTGTPVGSALRALVWARIDAVLQRSWRVLDLGCGTGADAVRLASRGVEVVALDASANMLTVAQQKADAAGCRERIEFHVLSLEALGSLPQQRPFDGVLSNFGALNCVQNLPALIREVATRLEPGAGLVWVLLGRRVPWEWAWYLAQGAPEKAWRRLRPGGAPWRGLTIQYPPPVEVARLLEPYFRVRRISPLGVALPPTYAAAWLEHSPNVLRALVKLESWVQGCRALASWSDHYIIEAVRLR